MTLHRFSPCMANLKYIHIVRDWKLRIFYVRCKQGFVVTELVVSETHYSYNKLIDIFLDMYPSVDLTFGSVYR